MSLKRPLKRDSIAVVGSGRGCEESLRTSAMGTPDLPRFVGWGGAGQFTELYCSFTRFSYSLRRVERASSPTGLGSTGSGRRGAVDDSERVSGIVCSEVESRMVAIRTIRGSIFGGRRGRGWPFD
jgi:hypothetical protein